VTTSSYSVGKCATKMGETSGRKRKYKTAAIGRRTVELADLGRRRSTQYFPHLPGVAFSARFLSFFAGCDDPLPQSLPDWLAGLSLSLSLFL
jgi:hypothetical protein